MHVRFLLKPIPKLFPLTISRGTSAVSTNLFVEVEQDGVVGLGEFAPGTGWDPSLTVQFQEEIRQLFASDVRGMSIHALWQRGRDMGLHPGALAAADIAMWDLLSNQAQMPLYRMLGLGKPIEPTSVTVGINPPEVVRERVHTVLDMTEAKKLKVKLGSPDGLEADKAIYEAARAGAKRFGVSLRVDANGGWEPDGAVEMDRWLAERGCEYIEQPLAAGREHEMPYVFSHRKLPVFLDESCQMSQDVPKIADRCDGVNLKLMKTGGLTEALRLVGTARAHGLKTMIGCMGDSSIAIAAGAAIGSLFDHIDLDSHLNLDPDPAEGLVYLSGVVLPPNRPGHGARLKPGSWDPVAS